MLKRLINSIRVIYSPSFPRLVTYMLQSCEYKVGRYLKWFWTVDDFSTIQRRSDLEKTDVAMQIYGLMCIGMAAEAVAGIIIFCLGLSRTLVGGVGFGLATIIITPILWSQAIIIPVALGRIFIITPKEKELINKSSKIFTKHPGLKIVVAGSYGKTTMKEILKTVLSEGKVIAATPANKNVPVSHAVYAKKLSGKEDILIIELGEGAPGDIKRFSETIKPDIAVITGLSPAHIDSYKTLEAAGKDIFTLKDYVKASNLFVNGESEMAKPFVPKEANLFDSSGALGWKVKNVKSTIEGLSFELTTGSKTLKLKSQLIGKHHIGVLAFAAALADRLGLRVDQIEKGIAKTRAFEHRMQPYMLNDAWIIDDTYNGNIEGIRVGTELLAELPAKRKIYVTPGLVEQGNKAAEVHEKLGRLIAKANPDRVVLMKNSAEQHIQKGLIAGGYKGELKVEENPLKFYENLASMVASGDLVMLQNDWSDSYR